MGRVIFTRTGKNSAVLDLRRKLVDASSIAEQLVSIDFPIMFPVYKRLQKLYLEVANLYRHEPSRRIP